MVQPTKPASALTPLPTSVSASTLITLPHLSQCLHRCCRAAGRSSRASSADRTASLHALLRNPDGLSAQHSRGRLLPVVDYLVRHGADVNARDEDGRSALHLAAGAGDVAMVAKLAELGIDVNGKDNVGGEREFPCARQAGLCSHGPASHLGAHAGSATPVKPSLTGSIHAAWLCSRGVGCTLWSPKLVPRS